MKRDTPFIDEFLADRRWRQLEDGKPRLSEEDMQRAQLGPRGIVGQPDQTKMTPQRQKKTPFSFDPGHTA